jgi:sec-independent protein translocase protein TatA
MEIGVIVLLALLLFGAGRIADVGKGIGQGIRHLKEGLREAEPERANEKNPAT